MRTFINQMQSKYVVVSKSGSWIRSRTVGVLQGMSAHDERIDRLFRELQDEVVLAGEFVSWDVIIIQPLGN